LVWVAFTAAWTFALLSAFPIEARDAVVSKEVGFSAGKSLHVLAYAFYTLLTLWLGRDRWWRWPLLAFVSMHAIGTEYLQQFVDRTSSLLDVGLDHAGILLSVALTWRKWRAS
jgi:hypothetical protein